MKRAQRGYESAFSGQETFRVTLNLVIIDRFVVKLQKWQTFLK